MSQTTAPFPFLSVVVPAYNEEATLDAVVEKLLTIPRLLEVVVVDDGSTDRTREVARGLADEHARVRVVRHEQEPRQDRGAAHRLRATRGEVVIVQDADLEYDPAESALLKPILDGHAEVVYGSRFLGGRATRVLYF